VEANPPDQAPLDFQYRYLSGNDSRSKGEKVHFYGGPEFFLSS
jgi:hypothetical protein